MGASVVSLLVTGCAAPVGGPKSPSCSGDRPKTIVMRWQRLVLDPQGGTCDRCAATERSLNEAHRLLVRALRPLEIRVELVKARLTADEFKAAPTESNRIFINDAALEDILGAETGDSPCSRICGEANCRTLIVDGVTYEAIPSQLIVRAGLRVAADLVAPPTPGGSCCPSGDAPASAGDPNWQPMPWLSD